MLIRMKPKRNRVVFSDREVTKRATPEEVLNYAVKNDVEILEHTHKNKKGKSIVFYQIGLYKIGGVETFLHNLGHKYKDYNITVMYDTADVYQLLRLAPYVNLKKNTGQIDCDVLILNTYSLSRVLDDPNFKWKQAYQMIHADFRGQMKVENLFFYPHPKMTGYLAVSKSAHDGLKERFNLKSTILYNFVDQELFHSNTDRVLKIITLSRGTREKGIEKILEVALEFKREKIPFLWLLCGTIEEQDVPYEIIKGLKDIPEIIFIPPSIHNTNLIPFCDYVAQLSRVESYCYSIHEGFSHRVPALVTNFPETKHFMKDGENGYVLDMDLGNLDVHKIYNEIPTQVKYEEKCNHKKWKKLFEKGVI